MADTVYRVLTVYETDTNSAQRSVTGLIGTFDHLMNLMDRAKGMLATVLDLHASAQKARVAIAGMLSGAGIPGTKNFENALKMSSEIIAKMRKDARELPGEFEDLEKIFENTILGGGRAGKSVIDMEKMSAQVMAVSNAWMPAEQAGREFAMMMEGRAGAHNVLWQRLKGNMSEAAQDAQKFNAMSAPEHWKEIEKSLAAFGPMMKAYATTWDATFSSTKQFAKELTMTATDAFTKSLQKSLDDVNSWFEKNRPEIESFAETVGKKLAEGFKFIKEVFAFLVEHRQLLLTIAQAWAIGKFTGFAGTLSSKGVGSEGIGKAVGLAPAMLQGAVSSVAIAKMTGDMGDWSATWEKFRLGLAGVEGALSQLPGPIGAVATLLMVLHRALEWVADQFDASHKTSIKQEGESAAVRATFAPERAHTLIARGAMIEYARQAKAITMSGELDVGRYKTYLAYRKVSGEEADNAVKYAQEAIKALGKFNVMSRAALIPYAPTGGKEDPLEKHGKAKSNQMNVAVRIEQTINTNDDPDRLLIATKKAIEESMKRPLLTFNRHVLAP